MTLRIGWLTPFTNRSGVGTFSKAVTDAFPDSHAGEALDVTIIAPLTDGLYRSRHRVVDIASAAADSGFYALFDLLVFNIGNNAPYHEKILEVLRHFPGIVVCHDYVYQHLLAHMVYGKANSFADYIALIARYGSAKSLRVARQSNITRACGLFYAPWDSDVSASEPLAAPLLQLASALVVHSAFAERYARDRFDGPILRLGMPHDQRPRTEDRGAPVLPGRSSRRTVLASFGHIQSTKCIDDVIRAIAGSAPLRESVRYVVAGFAGDVAYMTLLRDLIREHGLGTAVELRPNLSDPDLERLVAEADGFVNLRYPNTEGASVSLIEQLGTGKPVIILDTGCYAEVPDDAAIKVARPRDIPALAAALDRMTAGGGDLADMGQRGRNYAMRQSCDSYVAGLLGFLRGEQPLLERRGLAHGRCLIDVEAPERSGAPDRSPWASALSTARTTFDLLDTGSLATDPLLIRDLGPDRIADYVQAAVIRDGTNRHLPEALRAFFRDKADVYLFVRTLQIVRDAAFDGDPDSLEALPAVCPHGDATFWEVVAAMGLPVLSVVAQHAFFKVAPDETICPVEPDRASDPMLVPLQIADALSHRNRAKLVAPPEDLDRLIGWLRRGPAEETDQHLEPLAVGGRVAVGSPEQRRHLRTRGFFKASGDHVWSGADYATVQLLPAPKARRIIVSGQALDPSLPVTITATVQTAAGPVASKAATGVTSFDVEIPSSGRPVPGSPLSLVIRSSPRRPREFGESDDPRRLGFCLYAVSVA